MKTTDVVVVGYTEEGRSAGPWHAWLLSGLKRRLAQKVAGEVFAIGGTIVSDHRALLIGG